MVLHKSQNPFGKWNLQVSEREMCGDWEIPWPNHLFFHIQGMFFFELLRLDVSRVGEGVDTLSYKGTFNQTKSFTPNIYFLLNVFCLWWFAFRIDSKLGAC